MDCAKIISNQKEESISVCKGLTVIVLNSDILLKKYWLVCMCHTSGYPCLFTPWKVKCNTNYYFLERSMAIASWTTYWIIENPGHYPLTNLGKSKNFVFGWFDSLRPINNLLVIKGPFFLGWTSTKLGLMCLAQGHKAVMPLRLEPGTPRSQVKHSTTEPLRSINQSKNVSFE